MSGQGDSSSGDGVGKNHTPNLSQSEVDPNPSSSQSGQSRPRPFKHPSFLNFMEDPTPSQNPSMPFNANLWPSGPRPTSREQEQTSVSTPTSFSSSDFLTLTPFHQHPHQADTGNTGNTGNTGIDEFSPTPTSTSTLAARASTSADLHLAAVQFHQFPAQVQNQFQVPILSAPTFTTTSTPAQFQMARNQNPTLSNEDNLNLNINPCSISRLHPQPRPAPRILSNFIIRGVEIPLEVWARAFMQRHDILKCAQALFDKLFTDLEIVGSNKSGRKSMDKLDENRLEVIRIVATWMKNNADVSPYSFDPSREGEIQVDPEDARSIDHKVFVDRRNDRKRQIEDKQKNPKRKHSN